MNLIEIAEDLKNVPDQYLMQEVQQPSGNFPAYLVVSELSRRKRMREKVAKEIPTQTVAEELATPPQMPQMGTMMPQGMPQAGLMAMPQAQTELAAQDVMGATPPEMMMPQMAGGGMVSFKQGGDVIRAFDGLPEEMYQDAGPPGRGIFPAIGDFFRGGFYNDITTLESLGYTPAQISQMTPEQRAEVARQVRTPAAVVPAAVTPAAVRPAAAPGGAPAPAAAPGGAPGGPRAPVPQINMPQIAMPEMPTEYARQTARAQRMADYEQAVPDRLTPFLQEAIAKREGDIEKRRSSNINEALIQAGLGAMRAKPKFGGTAGLFEVLGAGGQEGFNVFREGMKDIRQSEEALLSSRAKMMEAQSLRDQNKFKLADEAEKQSREDYKLALDAANTQSAIALRNLQARKIPAEIGLLEAQADYARSGGRTAAADQKAADEYAKSKLLMSGVLPNSPNYMSEYARLRNEYLTSIAGGGGITQIPAAPASGAGGARFVGFE